jgi:hypothetical protein
VPVTEHGLFVNDVIVAGDVAASLFEQAADEAATTAKEMSVRARIESGESRYLADDGCGEVTRHLTRPPPYREHLCGKFVRWSF